MSSHPTQEGLSADLTGELGRPSTVLLLAPALDHREDEACMDLLTVTDPGDEDVLVISFSQSPDDRIELWEAHADGRMPAKMGIIAVGDRRRSAAGAARQTPLGASGSVSVTAVRDPGDLTGIGMRITDYLSEWEGDGNQVVVCIHSLTTLLQFTDLKRVFRFLHVLKTRFEALGAVTHLHLDPTAHDEQTVRVISQLADLTAEPDGDGGWTVAGG